MNFTPSRPVIHRPIEGSSSARPAPERPLPPFRTQAANALRAARRALAATARGQDIWLTPAASEAHRAICQSNQCGFFRASDQRCAHPQCGCFTKLKTRLATEQCPAGLFAGPFSEAPSSRPA